MTVHCLQAFISYNLSWSKVCKNEKHDISHINSICTIYEVDMKKKQCGGTSVGWSNAT